MPHTRNEAKCGWDRDHVPNLYYLPLEKNSGQCSDPCSLIVFRELQCHRDAFTELFANEILYEFLGREYLGKNVSFSKH